MSHQNQIKTRHGGDRWKDAIFIGAAVLLTALAIGATTPARREEVELGTTTPVRLQRARGRDHVAARDFVTLDATQPQTDVLARARLVHLAMERLDARDDRVHDRAVAPAEQLDRVA